MLCWHCMQLNLDSKNVVKNKIQYLPSKCSVVEYKVAENGNTQEKYLKTALKYST